MADRILLTFVDGHGGHVRQTIGLQANARFVSQTVNGSSTLQFEYLRIESSQPRLALESPGLELYWEIGGGAPILPPQSANKGPLIFTGDVRDIALWIKVPSFLLPLHNAGRDVADPNDGDWAWLAVHARAGTTGLQMDQCGIAIGGDPGGILGWKEEKLWLPAKGGGIGIDSALNFASVTPQAFFFLSGTKPHLYLESASERIFGLRRIPGPDPSPLTVRWQRDNDQVWRIHFERSLQCSLSAPLAMLQGDEIISISQTPSPGGFEAPRMGTQWLVNISGSSSVCRQIFRRNWDDMIEAGRRTEGASKNFIFGIDFEQNIPVSTFSFELSCFRNAPNSAQSEPAFALSQVLPEWSKSSVANLAFSNVLTDEGTPLRARAKISAKRTNSSNLLLTVSKTDEKVTEDFFANVRMGSLDVRFATTRDGIGFVGDPPANPANICCEFGATNENPQRGQISRPTLLGFQIGNIGSCAGLDTSKSPASDANQGALSLLVSSVQPGGIDLNAQASTFDVAPPPLILSIPDPPGKDEPLVLRVTESVFATEPSSRNMSLQRTEAPKDRFQPRQIRVLYIDRFPFLVVLIRTNDFRDFSFQNGAVELAYWSTSGVFPGWQLRASADRFELLLPPQGIGEEMEKTKLDSDIEGRLVDYRFTPPAYLNLNASDLPRLYGGSPWNLRYLLNELRSNQLAGLPLRDMRFEMLYGMQMQVTDVAYLRIAEILSRLGYPRRGMNSNRPAELADGRLNFAGYDDLVREWTGIVGRLQTRLGTYEVFDDRQQDFNDKGEPVGLQLSGDQNSKSVVARLRKQADLETSIPEIESGVGFTIPTGHLAGSFAWAFDSRLIYQALWNPANDPTHGQDPDFVESTAATLARLYFSALGGWGSEQATFDNGRTVIAAEIEGGRVSQLRIDRIGRIGVFWNRARFVTIYRRSVLPSDQFVSEQEGLEGRPILRKYEQYVEFLEKERAFPDPQTNNVSPTKSACLTGCSCYEKIFVDSSWGEDVYQGGQGIGWKVPLRAPNLRPDVYGTVNVGLHFYADPRDATTTATAFIDNPETLYFWTDTRNNLTDDTDTWPPVPDLDWGRYTPFTSVTGEPAPTQWPADPVLTGAADFTFRLRGLDRPTNLVGHLFPQNSPADATQLGALLSYVTVSRGTANLLNDQPPAGNPSPKSAIDNQFLQLKSDFENAVALVQQLGGAAAEIVDPAKSNVTSLKQLLDQDGPIKKLEKSLSADPTQLVKYLQANTDLLKRRIRDAIGWTYERGESDLVAIGDKLQATFEKASDVILDVLEATSSLSAAIDSAKAKEDTSNAWLGNLKSFLSSANIGNLTRYLSSRGVPDLLTPLIAKIRTDTPNRPIDLSQAAALLKGDLNRLQIQLNAWKQDSDVDAILNAVNFENWQSELSGIDGTLANAWKLVSALLEVVNDLSEGLESAQNTEDSSQKWLNKLRAFVASQQLENLAQYAWLRGIPNPLPALVSSVQARISSASVDLSQAAGDLKRDLTGIQNQVKTWKDSLDNVKSALKTGAPDPNAVSEFRETWKTISDGLNELKQAGESQKTAAVSTFKAILEGVGSSIKAEREGAAQSIAAAFATDKQVDEIISAVEASVGTFNISNLTSALDSVDTGIAFLKNASANVQDWRSRFQQSVAATGSFLRTLQQKDDDTSKVFEKVTGAIPALQTDRAFGEAPKVPMLDFSKMSNLGPELGDLGKAFQSVGYSFLDAEKVVKMTPITALVDQALDEAGQLVQEAGKLKASAIQLAVDTLQDRLLPNLPNVDQLKQQLGDLFPNIAGLNLKSLLGDTPVSGGLADSIKKNVKLSHGFDPQTLSGFVDAVVDNVAIGNDLTLLSFGPFVLRLRKAVFFAHLRVEATSQGATQRTEEGRITADWELGLSDTPIVTFKGSSLALKNGNVSMDLDPKHIELANVLKAISDLTSKFSGDPNTSQPFSLPEDLQKKLPQISKVIGTACRLNLQIPPIEGGSFAIDNLSLAAFMELGVTIANPAFLSISAGLSLASKKAPFTITIFILGGSGWVDLDASAVYSIDLNAKGGLLIDVNADVGIGASAQVGIDLGFLRGSIFIAAAIEILAQVSLDSSTFSISFDLIFAGNVNVLGIIDASININLSMRYQTGGALIGEGSVSISIKICWCFTLSLNASFSYTFGGAHQSGQTQNSFGAARGAWFADSEDSYFLEATDATDEGLMQCSYPLRPRRFRTVTSEAVPSAGMTLEHLIDQMFAVESLIT